MTDTAASTGSPARNASCGPLPTPRSKATPAAASVSTLTALVRKNSPLDRRTISRVGIPTRCSSQPPTASEPAPPPGSSAPEPICVHAISRAAGVATPGKNSRKMTTKARHEPTSSATAAATKTGFIALSSCTTGRRSGTASSPVTPHAASTSTVSNLRATARRSVTGVGLALIVDMG